MLKELSIPLLILDLLLSDDIAIKKGLYQSYLIQTEYRLKFIIILKVRLIWRSLFICKP